MLPRPAPPGHRSRGRYFKSNWPDFVLRQGLMARVAFMYIPARAGGGIVGGEVLRLKRQ